MVSFIKTLIKFIKVFKLKGFTLIELLVVLIIIAILVGLAIPNFTRTRERALDKEAQTALKLIQAAQRVYQSKYGTYWPAAALADINTNLQLDLASRSWNFTVPSASATVFTANATRADLSRVWNITEDTSAAPSCSGTNCP